PGLTAATPALAQSYSHTNLGSAGISLQVIDPSGAFIAQATVTVKELSRDHTVHGTADKDGRLLLWAPRGGRYLLTVSAPYMHSFTEEVELRSGQVLSLPVRLSVAGLMGEVTFIDPSSIPARESVPPSAAPAPVIRSGPSAMQN